MKIKFNILFCLYCLAAFSQGSLNKMPLLSDSADFKFIVSGHIHGNGTSSSGYPASSVLANIDKINSLGASMFFSCGDLYHDFVNDTFGVNQSFLRKIKMPIFNAVGNHDLSGRKYFEKFGRTFYSFFVKNTAFFIADTELDDSHIKGEQLDSLKNFLAQVYSRKSSFVFIFSHRPIWCEENQSLKGLFRFNTRGSNGTNFENDIFPLLKKTSLNANVFWCSGSLDQAPASFFYYPLDNSKITYLQSAIRDKSSDAILLVSINNNTINLETVSLTKDKCESLETYNLEFYKNAGSVFVEEQLNFRLIPLYVKQVFTHRYFYYGSIFCFVLILLYRLFFKWKKSK